MELHIKKVLAEAIGFASLAKFGFDKSWDNWKKSDSIDLTRKDDDELERLASLLEKHKGKRGVPVLLRDLATWRAAVTVDPTAAKARTLPQFETLLAMHLAATPRKHLYWRQDDGTMECVYVNRIKYHPATRDRGHLDPASVEVEIFWKEFGGIRKQNVSFDESGVRGFTIIAALANQALFVETAELRERYLAEIARFNSLHDKIGMQFWARGTATDDCDGNSSGRDSSWYWSRSNSYVLDAGDQPSRVVLDVFYEDEGKDRDDRYTNVDRWYWRGQEYLVRNATAKADDADVKRSSDYYAEDDEDEDKPRKPVDLDADENEDIPGITPEDAGEEPPTIEIPIHPNVAVFHLAKHVRLRIHISNLEEYVYDASLIEKLVIPSEHKALIHMLVEHRTLGFTDVIRGKAGGAVVLLAGPPGVGKTLCAEIYAETEARALYSIQCSQLGTDPTELEDELLKVFARGARWGAVMLLDEADVYVHTRGDNMQQNAIVGVFLRVLEYQNAVLFMTTNRPDDVDDAIASRCIAKIQFRTPTVEEQIRIWRILAEGSNANIDEASIKAIAVAHPTLSGRDVKNLLKLAMLIQGNEPISPTTIEFVKQFKPTKAL